ncbi:MAG TPA: DNA repair protein RecN [Thermoanaerobaculia bacterium]|nr:DNA repair protein RecN [Thermoanaerobaculia bacterium]
MLRELRVKNLAVVADAALELGPGLNALTGETGAGKSLIVDSLALLAGGRASVDAIRAGADSLQVSGLFEPAPGPWRTILEEAGLDAEEGELLIRREVSRGGRNRVFVNDQPATARLLADLAPELLRIHGQREELGLTTPDLQRAWLDASGKAEGAERLAEVAAAWRSWRDKADRLARLTGDERGRRERLELLQHQARDIDAAGLVEGEEVELAAEREVLRHAEAIRLGLGGALALLAEDEDAATTRIARAAGHLGGLAAWEPRALEWGGQLAEARILLTEIAREASERLARVESDPRRLDQVEDRLALLERLFRRYGSGSAEVLALRRQITEELAELEGAGEDQGDLEAAVAEALERYRRAALELSSARARWGEALAGRIEAELGDLGLAKARFGVRLERRARADSPLTLDGVRVDFGAEGLDQVVFEFAPNPGEPMASLARIASGGELSRLYLALQLAAGGRDGGDATLIFDEVDVGIGGAQAAALGEKLQRLAGASQILVVTHQPQVAAWADLHLRLRKDERDGRTYTSVEPLAHEARVEEVARMLAGSKVTDLSRSHARELLAASERRG